MMGGDRFARIPERLTEMLKRRELTSDHYLVMTFLVAEADYRTRQATFASLKSLEEGVWWQRSGQHLRDVLHELRELGEIAYERSQGSRDPYVITIVPGDYFGAAQNIKQSTEIGGDFKREDPNFKREGGLSFEVTNDDLKSATFANPDGETESERPRLRAVGSDSPSTSKASALRGGEDDLGREVQMSVIADSRADVSELSGVSSREPIPPLEERDARNAWLVDLLRATDPARTRPNDDDDDDDDDDLQADARRSIRL
jgi:hypothetical protein